MTMSEFLKTKFATILLCAGLVFVMVITARILVQKQVIDREIGKLESQMERINKDNEELTSLIQYLNTPEYKEKEAREKLNLAKEGEHVVVLPGGEVASAKDEKPQEQPANYKLWLDYFFNAHKSP
jgi:cell division protein FtsB